MSRYIDVARVIAQTMFPRTPLSVAIDVTLGAAEAAKAKRPAWWHWTIYIAAAITVARITGIGHVMAEHDKTRKP